ncbi:hypothetical protein FBUS_02574 [Fasciolopsis buskii]|uniref:Uncharacterized protein n=1 Tax=Fasciolopsis buskii TaxID=27845 RepID=A0A8E0RZB2_9TREM|nr:hypothetical protein FBUS_02574 [Fasciolopsis buski]
MAEFVSRVSNYPVVNESCKVAGVAYQWFKGKDSVNHLVTRLEDIASTLALMVKPVTETDIAQKLDSVACHQILDRFESVCPTLKETSTEELLGAVANRALTLAETCTDYCLPEDPAAAIAGEDASRTQRLSRIRKRAENQLLVLFHTCVERAQFLLNGLSSSTAHLTQNISVSSLGDTLTQVYSVLTFAANTAKTVSIPLLVQGLVTVRDQTEKLNSQLRESGKLSWIDLENLIHGLDKVKLFLNEQMNKEAHEGHQTKQIESSRDQTAATSTVNFLRIFFVFSSLSRYLTKSMMGHRNGALLH